MLRPSVALAVILGLSTACGSGIKTKENVQAAILDRLQSKTGLNMAELEVNTTDVSFDKNLAFATVAIHPKGDADVKHGMSMKYTLEDRDGKWVVLNAGGAKLGGPVSPGAGTLPTGHPGVGGSSALPNPHSPSNPGTGSEGSAR